MINTSVNKNEYTIQSGVVEYPIGFPFYFNPDRTPQLLVKIGEEELRFNHNFELSEDKGSVVLRPTEEESWTLEGPEDFSWMTKWDGMDLLIKRAVPFVQDSDYQLGRISSEQIERDFDLSVMRDQALDSEIKKLRNEVVDEFIATDSRFDSIQEQTDDEFRDVRDEFAEADRALSDKIIETKTELQNSIDNIPDTYTKEELDVKFAEIPEAVDAYTKAEVDAKLSSVYKFKGSVANVGELPANAVVGDTYNVEDTGANYAWDGTKWDKLSDTIDLSDYATKEDINAIGGDGTAGQVLTKTADGMMWQDDASLPDQTGNTGKFLMTNGSMASWSDKPLVNNNTEGLGIIGNTNEHKSVAIGKLAFTNKNGCVAISDNYGSAVADELYAVCIGGGTKASGVYSIALGAYAKAQALSAIQLGVGTNSDAKTFKVANGNGNFEMMSADGTIPAERMSATAGTTGQVLTKTDTGMAWQDTSGGGGDYLPLSGGTMTGPINIYQENTNYQKRSIFTTVVKPTDSAASGNLFEIKQDQSSVYVPAFKVTGNIAPNTDESVDFGNASYHFRNVFTKYINAGRDDGPNYATDLYNITVPVKKGTMALLEDIPESTQLETLPVASSDNLNKIYQYTGETSETYTNGYFYKCTETDGVYSWTQVNVQGGGGASLPDQTGNAGKVLMTDGSTASWSDKPLVNTASNINCVGIGRFAGAGRLYTVNIGGNSACNANGAVALGYSAQTTADALYGIAIGYSVSTNGVHAIQLGSTGSGWTTNSDANTFKVANANGNFEMMDANGNVPLDRLTYVTDQIGDISTALTAILGE